MDRSERERREIERAFAESEKPPISSGDFVKIGNTNGFRKAMDVIDRMLQSAPTSDELYRRNAQAARKSGKHPPCRLCNDTGYTLPGENIAKICDCRVASMRSAQKRQQEQRTPNKDIVSILFDDSDGAA